eukprot:3173864-Amphidinium_carterae.1
MGIGRTGRWEGDGHFWKAGRDGQPVIAQSGSYTILAHFKSKTTNPLGRSFGCNACFEKRQ